MAAEGVFQPAVGKVQDDDGDDEEDDDRDTRENDDGQEAGLVGRLLLEVMGDLFQVLRDFLEVLVKFLCEPMRMLRVIVLVAHAGLDASRLAGVK